MLWRQQCNNSAAAIVTVCGGDRAVVLDRWLRRWHCVVACVCMWLCVAVHDVVYMLPGQGRHLRSVLPTFNMYRNLHASPIASHLTIIIIII